MNRFFRSLRRAFDPVDVESPRRLWAIGLLALAGVAYSFAFSPFGESRPINLLLFFGSLTIFSLVSELKKLWDRVERLEAELRFRPASPPEPPQLVNSN